MKPTRLSHEDEGDLEWYLSSGQALFERSTVGAMLDRAEMYAYARPDLGPYVEPTEDDLVRVKRRGVCEDIRVIESAYDPYTAHPTAEHRAGGGHMPPDGDLSDAADMSRHFRRMGAQDPVSVVVLDLYYGDRGARYAGGKPGRIFAVYVCTDAGRELLERDAKETRKRQNGHGTVDMALADHLRLENQASNEWGRSLLGYECGIGGCGLDSGHEGNHDPTRVKPKRKNWRRLMLQACDVQARHLMVAAAVAFNETKVERKGARTKRRGRR